MRKVLGVLFLILCTLQAQENNGILVSGDGVVESEPDLATIRLGVSFQDKTADKVYQQTNATINQVINALQKQGVKKEDIKTEGIGLYPQYDYTDGKQKFTGYQMYHNLSVQVKKIDRISNVIDNATLAGANTISGISFGFQDPEKLRRQARVKAIDAAFRKAKEIAEGANLKLGKVLQITETTYPYEFDRGMEMGGGGAQSATIAPGTNAIRVSLTIRYEIKELINKE